MQCFSSLPAPRDRLCPWLYGWHYLDGSWGFQWWKKAGKEVHVDEQPNSNLTGIHLHSEFSWLSGQRQRPCWTCLLCRSTTSEGVRSWTHTWWGNVCGGTKEQICPSSSLGMCLPCSPSPAIRQTPEVLQLYSAQSSCRQVCILRNKPK